MTSSTPPVLIKEQYYTKVFAGDGTDKDNVPDPKIGYFYLDISAATLYGYDGTAWVDVSSAVSIAL